MKRLFKYSIISLLCMITVGLKAQTNDDCQGRISFQTGYVRGEQWRLIILQNQRWHAVQTIHPIGKIASGQRGL